MTASESFEYIYVLVVQIACDDFAPLQGLVAHPRKTSLALEEKQNTLASPLTGAKTDVN